MARRRKRNNGQSNGNSSNQKSVASGSEAPQAEQPEEPTNSEADSPSGPVASTSRPPSVKSETRNGHASEALSSESSVSPSNDANDHMKGAASVEAGGGGSPAVETAEEADSSEEEDDDDEDDEDEEPTLRYNRIHSQTVEDLFKKDTCSCLTVSERYLVLGSHNGLVTIFSRPGFPRSTTAAGVSPSKGKGRAIEEKPYTVETEGEYIVKKYRAHTAGIMDIVIDEESQFIGTASMDGESAVPSM